MTLYELIKQSKNIDELANALLESAIIDNKFLTVYCPFGCIHLNENLKCMLLPDEICSTYKVTKKDLKKYCVKSLLNTEQ